LIAGCDAAVTAGFQISQELAYLIGGQILHREPVYFFMQVARYEWQ
jgi:hypothetical protein